MAGQARFTAVLDACVLFPIATADALISLAKEGLYVAKWTTAIDDEWVAAAERVRPVLVGRLSTRRDTMSDANLDWEVDPAGWRALIPKWSATDWLQRPSVCETPGI